jgi:hypothetical protein
MKLSQLLNELRKTRLFENFMKENPDAYFSAGFFTLEEDEESNKYQLDFFIPSKNRVAVIEYSFDSEMKVQEDEIKDMLKLNENIKIDICDLKEKVKEISKEFKANKIIAILKDNKWNLTCISPTLDMLRINIDSLTGNVDKCEKASFIDFIRVVKNKK